MTLISPLSITNVDSACTPSSAVDIVKTPPLKVINPSECMPSSAELMVKVPPVKSSLFSALIPFCAYITGDIFSLPPPVVISIFPPLIST